MSQEQETPSGKQSREQIKRTVERTCPRIEVDQTKILTDEDQKLMEKQWAEEQACRELAEREGRQGLKARLAQVARKIEKRTERL